MTKQKRTALTLNIDVTSAPETIALAQRAEALGYDDIWLADPGGLDGLTLAALVLEKTQQVRVGIAVVPAYTRTPAVFASTFAVIEQTYPGRFIPGLGTSSHAIIENWHGLPLTKPLTRMRETMTLLRAMMAGEKTAFEGETLTSRGYRQPPVSGMPIYMAGLRSKMLECAAEIGDGVILNLFPRSALPLIMEHIEIGAKRAGKTLNDVEVVCRHMAFVTEDKATAREHFKKSFVGYYATPVYNKFLAWAGYEDVAQEIREGWATKDRDRTTAALSDELIDEIAILGTEAECQQSIKDYAAGGIDTNIITCSHPNADVKEQTLLAFSADRFSF